MPGRLVFRWGQGNDLTVSIGHVPPGMVNNNTCTPSALIYDGSKGKRLKLAFSGFSMRRKNRLVLNNNKYTYETTLIESRPVYYHTLT